MGAVLYSRFEAELIALYTPPLRRKATFFKMRRALKEFGGLTHVKRTSDLTPLAIASWLELNSHRAPMTNRSYLGSMKAACNYALSRGYLKSSPFSFRAEWIPIDQDEEDELETEAKVRHLTLDELGLFLGQLDAEALAGGWAERRLQALGYTYVHTGLRKSEALGLKVSDVLLKERVIKIRSRRRRRLKTRGSARLVGQPRDLSTVLERWMPETGCEWLFPGSRREGPWLHGGPGRRPLDAIKAVADRAGIPGATIHALRRSIATHAQRLGISEEEVKDQLGHSTVQTQRDWYREQDLANARHVADRIRFRLPSPPADQPFLCPN